MTQCSTERKRRHHMALPHTRSDTHKTFPHAVTRTTLQLDDHLHDKRRRLDMHRPIIHDTSECHHDLPVSLTVNNRNIATGVAAPHTLLSTTLSPHSVFQRIGIPVDRNLQQHHCKQHAHQSRNSTQPLTEGHPHLCNKPLHTRYQLLP